MHSSFTLLSTLCGLNLQAQLIALLSQNFALRFIKTVYKILRKI